jgi:hypothetical protein
MSKKDQVDIANFSICHLDTGKGLVAYLQKEAAGDEQLGMMRTYLVRMKRTHECIGYFSLKAGLVSVRETLVDENVSFDTIPGVELANFAVNAIYVQKYQIKGIGGVIFSNFILPIIGRAASYVGICLVYLFALPQPALLNHYGKYGFQRLNKDAEDKLHRRLKPSYDESCIFMYQLLKGK